MMKDVFKAQHIGCLELVRNTCSMICRLINNIFVPVTYVSSTKTFNDFFLPFHHRKMVVKQALIS
jgi:hypothetical protein